MVGLSRVLDDSPEPTRHSWTNTFDGSVTSPNLQNPTPLVKWQVPSLKTRSTQLAQQNLKKKAEIRRHLGFLASIPPRLAFLYSDPLKSSLR